jgi:AraC-like DNA-binding protein
MLSTHREYGITLDCRIMSATRQSPVLHTPPPLTRQLLAHLDRVEPHFHADNQIIYPGSGVLTVTTRTGIRIVPPRRALWLPVGQPHAHQAWGDAQICAVLLPPDINPLKRDRPTLLTVSPLMREVLLALTAPDSVPTSEPGPRTEHLRAVLFDELEPADTDSVALPEPHDDRLRAIAALLHEDPADDRSLAEFGRVVGAGERTLSRLFQTELGMSFPQWRGQLRLLHAAIGLLDGKTVQRVAYDCGYSSPSAFVAAFRGAFGTTPGRYQRTVQAD